MSMQERGWLREKLAEDFGDQWQDVRESGDPEQMKDFAIVKAYLYKVYYAPGKMQLF